MAFEVIEITKIDAVERAFSRILLSFRKSPVFLNVLAAFVSEVQNLLNAAEDVIELRSPAQAEWAQLDAIGRIVGQSRFLANFDSEPWFTPDASSRGADTGIAWVTGATLGGNVEASDAVFRQLIEGKIIRNFAVYGSVPEIQEAVLSAYGTQISFVRTGPMIVQGIVPDGTSLDIINLLEQTLTQVNADSVYYMPIPATTSISNIVLFSDYTP